MFRPYLTLPTSVHLLCLGTFLNRAGSLVVPFLTLYLKDRLGLGVHFATLAFAFFGAGCLIGNVLGGQLADRCGRRVVMMIAQFGGAAVLLVLSGLTNGPAILAAMLLYGMVAEMYRPAAQAMVADLVEPERRAFAYGLMYVSVNLGFAVGPVLGGLLAEYSFKLSFLANAAASSGYGLLILLAIRESLPSRADLPQAGSPPIGAVAAFGQIARDSLFMRFCLANLLISLVYMQAFTTFPLYLGELGFGPGEYGRIIAMNGLLIVLFQIPLTSLVTRHDRSVMLVLASLFTAGGFALHGVFTLPWQFKLAVATWTLGEMIQSAMLVPIVSELAPAELRARYMGVFSMCFSGASVIGAPLGGLALEHFGGATLWWLCTGFVVTGGLLYLSLGRRIARPPPTPATS